MKKINGNVQGIKNTLLEEMSALWDEQMAFNEFASYSLLDSMARYTEIISREISVYITRDGKIADVSIGDSSKATLPTMRTVRNLDGLCGVRCIHTHPSGDGRLSGVDVGTLKGSMLDAMAAVGVKDGKPVNMYIGFINERIDETTYKAICYGPLNPMRLPQGILMREIKEVDARIRLKTVLADEDTTERVILAGMSDNSEDEYDSIAELGELVKTAGAEIVGVFKQRRRSIDNATYIGSGKLQELSLKANELNADLIVFDDELSAVQIRNMEDTTGCRVIDRTQLILDIFAQRATSREGKLQVELAQQKYRLPRLSGSGIELSRLGGGIGTRGPGEKKLEIDKRRIRRRIYELEQELSEVERQRGLRRSRRDNNNQSLLALVGYTNAGKSTLLNAMSGSEEYVCNQLFATLDTVVRKVNLPSGQKILLSDTVGFINKLPHELVKAFHSTLEEVAAADLILHVVDSSSPYAQKQIDVVEEVLSSLGAIDIPQILVCNKSDAENAQSVFRSNAGRTVSISALNNTGLDMLSEQIEKALSESGNCVEIVIPYSRYELISLIRDNGRIIEKEHTDEGTRIKAVLSEGIAEKVRSLLEK